MTTNTFVDVTVTISFRNPPLLSNNRVWDSAKPSLFWARCSYKIEFHYHPEYPDFFNTLNVFHWFWFDRDYWPFLPWSVIWTRNGIVWVSEMFDAFLAHGSYLVTSASNCPYQLWKKCSSLAFRCCCMFGLSYTRVMPVVFFTSALVQTGRYVQFLVRRNWWEQMWQLVFLICSCARVHNPKSRTC